MAAETVVGELWARAQARDWPGFRDLLADDLLVEWPVTGEVFEGPDNYLAVQRQYPEGWSIRVLSLICEGDQVVAEVDVPHDGLGEFRVAMFATVRDGLLVHSREYWTKLNSEAPPDWRAPYRRRSA